jgi:hypothetical protein
VGNHEAYTACSSTADCEPGLVCGSWYNTTGSGLCSSPTTVTTMFAPCPLEARPGRPDAGTGWTSRVLSSDGKTLYNTCQQNCDIKSNTGCKPGMQCDHYLMQPGDQAVSACRPEGSLTLKSECDPSNDQCGPGLHCGDPDRRCYQYCRMGHSDCGAGTTGVCKPFTPHAVMRDGVEYGWCAMN